MEKLTVLSLEQALSLSYATQRFVHLGWRVIRIEATPSGNRLPGDPNRYVGKKGESKDDLCSHPPGRGESKDDLCSHPPGRGESKDDLCSHPPGRGEGKDDPCPHSEDDLCPSDLHAYFIGPNVGKETISLNLKDKRGREVLKRLIARLPVDIFACNTLPKRYKELGIDYETLSAVNPGLIWAGLSAMGPDYPDAPGYDPAIQAITGYMDLTGDPNGPPTLCGVPFVDLKAGDEVFANVCLALAEKARTGKGARIDVSMAQAAASWLVTTIPLLDLGYEPDEVRRSGNEHREFVPVNVYPTSDGYIYLAIGNDVQWKRLVSIDAFSSLASPVRETNEGRREERESLHDEIGSVTRDFRTGELVELFSTRGLVAAPIHTVSQVTEFPPVRDRLCTTRTPSGRPVRLPPPSVERDYLASCDRRLPYAPRYGQDTHRVFEESGFTNTEIAQLKEDGIIAW